VRELPVLSAGFRPFFWFGALNATGSIATWLAFLSGGAIATQGWPAQVLHAHEMIHGTVVAAAAGFLLTAVPSWCGSPALRGAPIGGLFALGKGPQASTSAAIDGTVPRVVQGETSDPRSHSSQRPIARRLPWADLLQRVFGIDALRCECGKPMRVLAAITNPTVARRILACIGLPQRAPPLAPARTAGDLSEPWLEESPDGFDQTPPRSWDPVV
jgi:hypothetical protein